MARRFSFGGIELDVRAGQANAVAEAEPLRLDPDSEDPFRILVLGDFSGRGASVGKPIRIDRDNLNQVMQTVGPEAAISLGDKERTSFLLKFDSLEDFEPDSVFKGCPLFRVIDDSAQGATSTNVAPNAVERDVQAEVTRLS